VGTFPEYESLDGLGLADLVRRREVSAAEVLEAAIERVQARNPALNAVVHPMFEAARAAARDPLPDGPFAGVPFLLKDLGAAYAGAPLAKGSRLFRGYRPGHHSEMVRRWLASGVIVLGKSATPELGLVPVTEPEAFGPTRNPWDPSRTPGGSSGGSAAAVAARLVPLASGGDGGGSIRIPASCCGLFGLKPSRGRVPAGPDAADVWQGFVVEHVLTRSVRDSAAMLDATHGADLGDYHRAPPPARPFLDEVGRPPGRLRIAWSAEPYLAPGAVHPDCRAALDDAVALLVSLGHDLVEARPPLDGRAWARAFVTMIAGEVWADLREAEQELGRPVRAGDIEAATRMLGVLGQTFGAGDYVRALRELKQTGRRIETFMVEQRVDCLLSPTLARPPIPIGSLFPGGVDRIAQRILGRLALGRLALALGGLDRSADSAFTFIPFTPVFNGSGQPSMSVPLSWNAEGLPVGVMLTARYGEDATLFRLAAQLEAARPWRERKPPICAGS
jgi:amidase